MNDLDDLVRQELRARVDAAEAKQADKPLLVLLEGLQERIRQAKIRRRWGAAGLSAMAIGVAIALPLALFSPGNRIEPTVAVPRASVPLSDVAATPRGWVPVAYGDVQISVPADWQVDSSRCDRATRGYVVIGNAAMSAMSHSPRCTHASNVVIIKVLPPGQGQTHRRTGYINGIALLGVHPVARGYASYLAPTLHVLISVRGPLGNKVLSTITRSPLSVVLAAGRHFPVPHSWRWRDFGGLRFATPLQWRTIKSRVWNPCWAAITSPRAVKLVKATVAVYSSCSSDLGGGMRPRHGLVVGAGPYLAPHAPARYGCRSLHGLRACFALPGPGSPLELVIEVAGRHKPTVIDLGLAGNGRESRTIFESIRPR